MNPIYRVAQTILLGVFIILLGGSCMSDIEYSTSPNDVLAFSVDTVKFDTVISAQGTNTRTFEIYNNNKKSLRITKAWLESGNSLFRINLDGIYIASGVSTDFEIRNKDSLRVFIEATLPENSSDYPVKAEDNLVLQLESGITQRVKLEAYSQDVIPVKSLVIHSDTTFSSAKPYQIYDSLVVAENTKLTLSPGVRLYFHPQSKLIVYGQIEANGSLDKPIQMRGDRLGNMFSNQPYDRIPGQWGGIEIKSSSYNNRLNYCDIHSALFGILCDSCNMNIMKLIVENSVIHNVTGNALELNACRAFVGNSQITNAGNNCVSLCGGAYQFVQCTIASFYSFDVRKGVALRFTNYLGGIARPLEQAQFLNCLITGLSNDEIQGDRKNNNEELSFNYLFSNCLLDTPEYEDDKLQNCFWDSEKNPVYRETNFYPRFNLEKLIYTFVPDSLSKAIGNADFNTSQYYYPNDRVGKSRLQKPDIGCYQRN